MYVSTVLEVSFDRARPCSRYFSTVLDRAGGLFRPCTSYVSTVFDLAWSVFRIFAQPKSLSRLFFFRPALTYARLWKSKHKVSTSTRVVLFHCDWLKFVSIWWDHDPSSSAGDDVCLCGVLADFLRSIGRSCCFLKRWQDSRRLLQLAWPLFKIPVQSVRCNITLILTL